MSDERARLQGMLDAGKISQAEYEKLLGALGESIKTSEMVVSIIENQGH